MIPPAAIKTNKTGKENKYFLPLSPIRSFFHPASQLAFLHIGHNPRRVANTIRNRRKSFSHIAGFLSSPAWHIQKNTIVPANLGTPPQNSITYQAPHGRKLQRNLKIMWIGVLLLRRYAASDFLTNTHCQKPPA